MAIGLKGAPAAVPWDALRARAGALPIPLGQVLDNISRAAQQLNLRLEWRRSQGDPVALVTLPQQHGLGKAPWQVEALELRDGELFVSGTVGKHKLDASPIVTEPLRVPTAHSEPLGNQPIVGAADKETRQK